MSDTSLPDKTERAAVSGVVVASRSGTLAQRTVFSSRRSTSPPLDSFHGSA